MFILPKPDNWGYLSFSSKIQHYMLKLERNHSYYVDKLYSKRIIKDICGNDVEIPKTIRVLKNNTDIRDDDINPNYMLKASHGSSWNINFGQDANTSKEYILESLKAWNCIFNADIEHQYSYIKPRFFIEEKIKCKYKGNDGKALTWSFYCLLGKVFYFQVIDKYADILDHYDMNWNLLNMEKNGKLGVTKPHNFDKMVQLSEKVAKEFEFLRIDFYLSDDDKIYFSEFTFSPCQGATIYGEYDYVFNKYWPKI
jgi:hypothetical protein